MTCSGLLITGDGDILVTGDPAPSSLTVNIGGHVEVIHGTEDFYPLLTEIENVHNGTLIIRTLVTGQRIFALRGSPVQIFERGDAPIVAEGVVEPTDKSEILTLYVDTALVVLGKLVTHPTDATRQMLVINTITCP